MKKLFYASIFSALLALPALFALMGIVDAAIAQVPSQKPTAGPLPKQAFPPYTEARLKNGIRVILIEDHSQPIVYLSTMLLSGSATDGMKTGVSEAVGSMLEKGTSTMSAEEIAKKLDFYGSAISTSTGPDNMGVATSSLKQYLGDVLPLYADVILNPQFPPDELNKYISNAISGLKAQRQDPHDPGRRMGRKVVYGNHPYGAFSTVESVSALTPADLKAWRAKNFVANNAVMAVVGDVTKSEIIPILDRYFGGMPKGTPSRPTFSTLTDLKGTKLILIDRPGSVQSSIRLQRLGLRRSDPLYDRADFLAAIFAGNGTIGFQNRMIQNLREAHGYTYSPGGSFTASVDPGVLVAVADVRTEVTDSALAQMLVEYRRLSSELVSPNELALDKNIVTGGFLLSVADPQSTAGRILNTIVYKLPADYYQHYARRIEAMTAPQLKEVAAKVFPPNDIAVIITGDASKIREGLSKFGPVSVYDLDLKPEGESKYDAAGVGLNEVIDKIESGVGASAMSKITDRTVKGKIAISFGPQNFEGEYVKIEAAPNKLAETITLPVGTLSRVSNGIKAWRAFGPNSQEITGEALAKEISDATFNEELHLRDAGWKVELLGKDKASGNYVVSILKGGASPELWSVDPSTGHVVQKSQEGEAGKTLITYSDFRTVDGVTYPFHVAIAGAQEASIDVTSLTYNTSPAESIFTR